MVPATDDPVRKLRSALDLIDNQLRPLPAERLIRESIEIYQSRQNELGLAEAYRIYGIFFKSQAVERMQTNYRENGFSDKSASYENRFDKSLEYLGKSRALLEKNGDVSSLPNVHLLLGWTHVQMKNTRAACEAFDESLKVHQLRVARYPATKITLPEEYSSFEQGIADQKARAGCNR
jgi:tetratricopeptide (TPR) repeat protein